MNQFKQVLKFEFSNYARSKPYIIITVVLVVLIAGLLTYPRVAGLWRHEGPAQPSGPRPKLALVDDVYKSDELLQRLAQAYPEDELVRTDETMDELRSKVVSGEYAAAVVLESPLKFTYLTVSVSMYEDPGRIIGAILAEKYQQTEIEALGLSAADAAALVHPDVDGTVTETGKNQAETFIYTYILIYALYMAIMLYGQFVASSVASEKSTRAMELLITSAKPLSLMFGKIIGTGLAGLLQFFVIFGSAFLFYNINGDVWADSPVMQRIFNIPIDMLLYVLLFFVIGFFLYAFIYGALGSLASRTEDVGTAIMPVTFLVIIALFVVIVGMSTGNLDSPLMVACSYIPFTSPMAMFTRIAMSNVPPIGIIVSVAIAVASTVGIGFLSAAIYRVGVLMYGKPPKLGELVRTLREKRT
ncbi:ABC-2 type transport system permease protein [Sporobacter termitidis DSM 10068]|uniref:ABC-2 type transport system permease protein n=1 Tax=Sporobacter termitidis DSM 10068 TaxID=1123282 RepID=A0A1M5Y0V2_9FIRM|nr:ABC transporter permease [Sporobacter termitidis]SHI05701.1 ABC-2 type transport system permease protein [Sporobacter termitidis DSM 10068]